MFKKATIIGTGMIGGSMALALKSRGLAKTVCAVDLHPEIVTYAIEHGIADQATLSLIEGVDQADLVIIATPVGKTTEVIEVIKPYLQVGTLVTDVGSTKAQVVTAAESALLATDVHFVGGHPMAGSEVQGITGCTEDLFAGAAYILTPTPNTDPESLQRLRLLIQGLGSRLLELNPELHDYLVASISHLPHVLAVTLVNTVDRIQATYPETLSLAAGGFRDSTRIAASNPEMWRDILSSNQVNILALIDQFSINLNIIREQIAGNSLPAITETLRNAQTLRQQLK